MKNLLAVLAIFISLSSISQTWQYSINEAYEVGVRDKLGEGKQEVTITIKSQDGKINLTKEVVTTDDDWKNLTFPEDFTAKKLKLADKEVTDFKITFSLGKEILFSTPFYYCSLDNDLNKSIKLLELPDYIQSRLIGEFVESNMYTNDKGVNFYVSQTINKGSEEQRITEIVYTISIRGEISEYEIRR